MSIVKPRKHQLEYMAFHNARPKHLLGTLAWHEMGSGKTLSALWLARQKLQEMKDKGVKSPKFLVIVPKSAVPTWKVECHTNTPDIYRDMIIYPYSQLHNAIKSVKYMDIRMIIFDESHALKSPKTDRIKLLGKFLEEVGTVGGKFEGGRIIQLTGTPFPNHAAEFYTAWAMCCSPNLIEAARRMNDIKRYEEWEQTFAQRKEMTWKYGKKKEKTGYALKFEGIANEDKLITILNEFVSYVPEMPGMLEKKIIPIDLGFADDKLLADANIEVPEAYMALVERLSRAKTPYMIDWIRDFIPCGKQLVVFAMNRAPIEALRDAFPKHVRLITGAEAGAQRAINLKDFQEGKFQIIAMTYAAGSESLNMQNAHVSLYHGYSWTSARLKQAEARTHRSGQMHSTLHYYLTSGANDAKILELVRKKGETISAVEALMADSQSKKSLGLDDLI